MATNTIAKAREQEIFVILETTAGTLVAPTTGSILIGAGFISSNQQQTFTDSPEIVNSRDILERFSDRTGAGDWSVPVLARPSGAAGTAPPEDVMLECLCGTKTVNASTSVVYTPAMTKLSCSVWYKKDHTVFFLKGATVGKGELALATKGAAMWNFSGQFMEKGWAGTCEIDGIHSAAATSVVVDDAKKFKVGALIEFEESSVTYNNTDAGYEVTAVNTATETLTISPALETDLDDDSIIRGWLPSGSISGDPVPNRDCSVEIDSTAVPVQEMSFVVDDMPQYLDQEISTSNFPTEYVEVQRNVSGSIKVFFRENDLAYYHDGVESIDKTVKQIIGDTAGSIIENYMAKTNLDVPSEEESDPTIALSMGYKALATSGEDSFSITYK